MLTCQICGYQHKTMLAPTHIRKHHNLTGAAYKEMFPGSVLRIQSAESRAKSSKSKIGKTSKLKGVPKTEEAKKNQSISMKAKYLSGEIKHWNTGNTTPLEVREKISVSNKIAAKNENNKLHEYHLKQNLRRLNEIYEAAAKFDCEIISITDKNGYVTAKCNKCMHTFTFSGQIFHMARLEQTQKLCPSCQPRATFSSKPEKEVVMFIKSIYDGLVIENDREQLKGKEIDIFIPALNLGIEFTGLYWHSEKQNSDRHHLISKKKFAAVSGIRLITLFEDEWNNKPDIVKSRLAGMLGCHTQKINGRDCDIVNLLPKSKNTFLERCHIQGKDISTVSLGLTYQERLVSVATFRRTNIVKGGDGTQWELSRFCSELNIRVMGGAGKLISNFVKNYLGKDELISYSDARWSDGELYKKLGFIFNSHSQPSYWYTLDYKTRQHRSNFMKHTLQQKFQLTDEVLNTKTEWEIMQDAGYDRIWDCGTSKWVLNTEPSL